MLIQPSASGALRMATAFSALTCPCAAGTAGWMAAVSGISTASGADGSAGASGWIVGTTGVMTGVSKLSAAGWTGSAGFAKKSAASVSTASGTMGCGAGFRAGRSGSCPKVPPGPTMSGSIGSLPPSFTSVWSGPRSTSKAARGRGALTFTGVMTGVSGSGCATGWAGAGCGAAPSSSASISSVTLWPQLRMPLSQSGRPRRKPVSSGSSSASSSSEPSSGSSSASAARAAARSARRSALCCARAAPRARAPPNTAHSHCQTSAGVRSKMYRLTHSASTSMMRFAAGRPQSSSRLPPSTAPSAPPPSQALTPFS